MGYTTRTQTGVIKKTKYDYPTLRLVGEVHPEESTPIHSPRAKLSPVTSRQSHVIGKLSHKTTKLKDGYRAKKLLDMDLQGLGHSLPFVPIDNITDGVDFIPPVAFGHEEVGMSAIARADRKIEQWLAIRAAHEKHLPRVVPQIDMRIDEARKARSSLLDVDANYRVTDLEARKRVIEERIADLETEGLAKSKFEPEAENIRGAIAAYKSGQIRYSNKYTLIWAGKVVDQAATYADFTKDRMERLDRYAKEHGPHWLWWERPLKMHPDALPRLSRCAELPRRLSSTGLGQYYISQCYWKRCEWVTRMPSMTTPDAPMPPPEFTAKFLNSPDGRTYCQAEGPKLVYHSLLDSGATYPSLHPWDFHELGIDSDNYGAQSLEKMNTANGVITSRVFEMYVTVTNDKMQSLVDPANAVWPFHTKNLGGLCPVVSVVNIPFAPDPEGIQGNHRLSGLLPFLACYATFTPTRNMAFLGEDRNDVMGGHKTPGQRRWDISMPSTIPSSAHAWPKYGDPKIKFTHRQGLIIDEDVADEDHASNTFFLPGTNQQTVVASNPKRDCEQARAVKKQAEAQQAGVEQV